jgi:hypothetical protein
VTARRSSRQEPRPPLGLEEFVPTNYWVSCVRSSVAV